MAHYISIFYIIVVLFGWLSTLIVIVPFYLIYTKDTMSYHIILSYVLDILKKVVIL
jgi:hypothetical protein